MKKQSGVSLITLVITIIVVIILAAIAMGNGVLDLGGRAQFTGFTMEMADLRDGFKAKSLEFQGRIQMQNRFPKDPQVYNFVARGLEKVASDYDRNYQLWLLEGQASKIPCTQIDREYAEKYLGLKTRYVDTYNERKQLLSYFVTPKGNVFCWPPYENEEKNYVNGETTVKTMDGKEINGADATNGTVNPTVKITFLNKEEVIIANSAPSDYNISGGSTEIDPTLPSVWYSSETASNSEHVKKWGVAQGYTFEGYSRNN